MIATVVCHVADISCLCCCGLAMYCSVTGWGLVGPNKDTPAFDTTAFFAAGGIMDSLGQRGASTTTLTPTLTLTLASERDC